MKTTLIVAVSFVLTYALLFLLTLAIDRADHHHAPPARRAEASTSTTTVPSWVNRAGIVAAIDAGKAELKLTTISGSSYCPKQSELSHWTKALIDYGHAFAFTPPPWQTRYFNARTLLCKSTISGKAYFANPASYSTGSWSKALKIYAGIRAVMAQ